MTTHRSFTPEFKAQVVLEVLTGVRSASEACHHYQLKPDLVSRWKAQFLEGAATVFAREAQMILPWHVWLNWSGWSDG